MPHFRLFSQLLNIIIPPRCPGSGDIVTEQHQLAPHFWADLHFIEDPKCCICGYPLPFEIGDNALCTACLDQKPYFQMSRSVFVYTPAIAKLILPFKHGDQTELAAIFSKWMAQYGAELFKDADFIIPVPLHYRRFWQRRYNQSALLANHLSKHTGIKTVPDALLRIKNTKSQGYMKPDERKKNVKNVFSIHPKHMEKLRGKKLILVDDVYTSGATIQEISRLLSRDAKAKTYVLTIARAVKDGDL